ncbi:N-acetylmuramoyl-L-alanine amidase [Candidatus Chloroploca asiatica]|uniref:N-acetylmuramoyl-L-alanine amidase domain-containing protein n=1 Tax=Candidatus Chloroploca asiatica TaxID=1506545 RepID=A0A2H3KWI7_9CHLR|nr:N-acetylmuramoyl-L-alanine amidase [Candidatus Chloroploca asiatica]PDV96731.1 hypothetical protein A9Q02_05760 [Candidatus Chloroploca asiatica]
MSNAVQAPLVSSTVFDLASIAPYQRLTEDAEHMPDGIHVFGAAFLHRDLALQLPMHEQYIITGPLQAVVDLRGTLGRPFHTTLRPGTIHIVPRGEPAAYHYRCQETPTMGIIDGSIAQTRDMEDTLWHCGITEGNDMSIAVQLPLGGQQDATPAQWEATTRLFDELIAHFGMAGRRSVLGHQEWSDNICPGPKLMPRLQFWRDNEQFVELVKADKSQQPPPPSADGPEQSLRYLVIFDELHVRAEPSVDAVVIMTLRQGETLVANGLVSGETLGDSANWVALADPQGFVHEHLLRPLEQG